ncbi:MAG: hypothetical protein E7291_02970 [Lachnospiraceae bacterium]|nr:hypothetical protein [Lachnospiraceae bacterium]
MKNNKSVRWVLLSLNLLEYTHVSIRRRLNGEIEYLGGGSVGSVLSRFPDSLVNYSTISDNVLIIYVL